MNSEFIKSIREGKERTCNLIAKRGGQWLGCVRSWIQWNAHNGDDVTWGSNEFLRLKAITVHEMEHLAATIAGDALSEYSRNLVTDEEKRELNIYKNPLNWTVEDGKMVFKPEHGLSFDMINITEGWNLRKYAK